MFAAVVYKSAARLGFVARRELRNEGRAINRLARGFERGKTTEQRPPANNVPAPPPAAQLIIRALNLSFGAEPLKYGPGRAGSLQSISWKFKC